MLEFRSLQRRKNCTKRIIIDVCFFGNNTIKVKVALERRLGNGGRKIDADITRMNYVVKLACSGHADKYADSNIVNLTSHNEDNREHTQKCLHSCQ